MNPYFMNDFSGLFNRVLSMRAKVCKQSHLEHIRTYRQEELQEASNRQVLNRGSTHRPIEQDCRGESQRNEGDRNRSARRSLEVR